MLSKGFEEYAKPIQALRLSVVLLFLNNTGSTKYEVEIVFPMIELLK
jgi:hypothetical protein